MKPNSPRGSSSERFFGLSIFAACVALHLFLVSLGWNNSLIQIHEGRQIQTALTARCLQTEPWRAAYPLPLFGPPWSAPYEFPFYQTAVAWFGNATGWPIEQSGRAVALGFLYLALPACFQILAVCGVPASRRWLFPGLLLLSPIYIYYSRSLMIESTAFCAAAWFLLAYTRALKSSGWAWLGAAVLFGIIAGLAKATTFAVFLAAALFYTIWQLIEHFRQKADRAGMAALALRGLLAAVPALVATFAWVRFTDTIKCANPLASALSSAHLQTFNYGTLAQRLDPGFWNKIAANTLNGVLSPVNAALILLFGLLLLGGRRLTVLGLLLCFAAGPLLFANLYSVHDYYYYACGAFLLAALVVAWSQLLEQPQFPLGARQATIVLSLGLQVLGFAQSYLPFQRKPLGEEPELGRILAQTTSPNDVLLVFGEEWNPSLAYYSGRRAVMVLDEQFDKAGAINEVLDRIEPGRVTALVATGNIRLAKDYFKPFLARLGLSSGAVLASADTHLYVAKATAAKFSDQIASMHLRQFAPVADSSTQDQVLPQMNLAAPQNLTTMMKPAPSKVMHPFGLANHTIDNRPVFDAHAPTTIIFPVPTGAREVAVGFGIVPGAYTDKLTTDGVEFRLELVEAGGTRHVLRTIFLDPANQPDDRGTQQAIIPLPRGLVGDLWCRTLPGPQGNAAFDWAYWSRIEIR